IWNGLMEAGGQQIGHAILQQNRPDVAAALGNPYFATSGYAAAVPLSTFASSPVLYVYAHTPARGWWYQQVLAGGGAMTFKPGPRLEVEVPTAMATVHSNSAYAMHGFAFDPAASPQQGAGIDRVQVYLNGDRNSGVHIGDAKLGSFDKYAAAVNP